MRIVQYLETVHSRQRASLHALLAGFPADAELSELTLPPGDAAVRQEEPCDSVYVLVEGRARTVIHQHGAAVHAFSDFEAVELFGEQEVLAGQPQYLADVVARTDCRFLVIPAADYLRWLLGDSEKLLERTRAILQMLLRQTAQERSSLYLTGTQRLAQYLLEYWEGHHKGGESVTVRHTHATISEEIGFTVRTVGRAVQALHLQGLIDLQRGKIVITTEQHERLSQELAALNQ